MQKAIIITLIVVALAAIFIGVSLSSKVDYAVLYSSMDSAETGEVLAILDEMTIDYKTSPNGSVMVPKAEADKLRFQLAAKGYPKGGLNYDIYEKASSFGATDIERQKYYQFQLQENIAQTLKSIDKVVDCTVLVNLAEQSKFVMSKDESNNSSASIMLTLRAGEQLNSNEVKVISFMVQKSVPGLTPENIAIMDTQMTMYSQNDSEGSGFVSGQMELQLAMAKELRQQILNLFTPVFGIGRLSANVNVVLDFDKHSTDTITLTPPTDEGGNAGIAVSMKTLQERLSGTGAAGAAPGVDANGGAPWYPTIGEATADSVYDRVTQEVNYEVNQIIDKLEKARGTISDISATLIIDGGEELTDILPEVRKQLSTAIGVPEDKVTVSSMKFAVNDPENTLTDDEKQAFADASGTNASNLVMYVAIAALAIIIIVIFVSSNVSAKKRKKMEEEYTALLAQANAEIEAKDEISIEDLLDQNSNSTLVKLQHLANSDPEAVAALLKNWLSDDFRR